MDPQLDWVAQTDAIVYTVCVDQVDLGFGSCIPASRWQGVQVDICYG